TDDISGTDGFKTNRFALSLTGASLTAINRTLIQVTAQGLCDHFTHTQSSAGRGVDFVAMMRLDHLDIDVIAKHLSGGFQQFEAKVHTDGVIRRKANGNIVSGAA